MGFTFPLFRGSPSCLSLRLTYSTCVHASLHFSTLHTPPQPGIALFPPKVRVKIRFQLPFPASFYLFHTKPPPPAKGIPPRALLAFHVPRSRAFVVASPRFAASNVPSVPSVSVLDFIIRCQARGRFLGQAAIFPPFLTSLPSFSSDISPSMLLRIFTATD